MKTTVQNLFPVSALGLGSGLSPLSEGFRTVETRSLSRLDRADQDCVAEEVPVALVYNGISHAVMMTTPFDLEAFAVGFTLAEGICQSVDEIFDVEIRDACRGKEAAITISSEAFWKLKDRRRAMTGRTGCGLCGTENLESAIRPAPSLPVTQTFDLCHYEQGLGYLEDVEALGELTGCTHAAVWLRHDGTVAFGREDVGRHVALDKLLGCRARTKALDGALFVSSRASYEMVQKAAMCGVEILFAVSAPTALAVDLAKRSGLTLSAFCRPGRGTVYTYPERLVRSETPR